MRRVVLGNEGSGMGLRVSLPGNDALTGDSSDPTRFSFDSNWTDIVPVHQVGLASITPSNFVIPFPDLGYRPFCEVRRLAGTTIYDDWFSAVQSGIGATIQTNLLNLGGGTFAMLYMVLSVPVPTQ